MPVLRPIASLTGIGQSWAMYAPDPIRRQEALDIAVTMSDGSTRLWTSTNYGHGLTPLVWYRWHKLKEQAVRVPEIRAGMVQWVVRELTTRSEHPTRVEMIVRSRELPAPGAVEIPEWQVESLYSEPLPDHP